MSKISFVKMSGAGNDFIIIDKSVNPDIVLSISVINSLCDRRNGIGADGVILIEDEKKYDFSMEYFNSDGSTGTLCGNGARCAIKFAENSGRIHKDSTRFLSNGIEYSGELLESGLITFNLNPPKTINKNIQLEAFGYNLPASFADTGSPHVVIDVNELKSVFVDEKDFTSGLDNFPVVKFGREIRNNRFFAPGGTNVNFIEILKGEIRTRTYERGVENETLACGTGAVASALISNIKYGLYPPLKLITKGGDTLIVNFEIKGSDIINVSLTGPAIEVFNGEISIN
jgi:diaminopimelate epimerase